MPKTRKEKDSLGNIAVSARADRRWMMKTYEVVSPLSAQEVSARLASLFSNEGVSYKMESLGISSTRTPIAILGIQPIMYTHNNWVSINPFAFVSGVDVRCEHGEGGLTKVIVRIDRRRAFLFVAIGICVSGLAASAMPEPVGAMVFIGFSCAAWFMHVPMLGCYLIKKEIADHLKCSTSEVHVTL